MELGVYTFAELTPDARTAQTVTAQQRIADWTRHQFEASTRLRGANFVGGPQDVVDKILYQHEIFGHQRFLIQFSVGTLPHEQVMRSIELFGTEVAPAVREEIAGREAKALR